jgi:hypothetical protein
MIAKLRDQKDILSSFDEELWISLVDNVVVQPDGGIQFNFSGKIF